jgi:hypothetical protein
MLRTQINSSFKNEVFYYKHIYFFQFFLFVFEYELPIFILSL